MSVGQSAGGIWRNYTRNLSMNTFGGFGGLYCSILMLEVKNFLPGSPSGPKQEAQRGVVETGQAGNNGQPVQETEVPTHYQNHLLMKRKRGLKIF